MKLLLITLLATGIALADDIEVEVDIEYPKLDDYNIVIPELDRPRGPDFDNMNCKPIQVCDEKSCQTVFVCR